MYSITLNIQFFGVYFWNTVCLVGSKLILCPNNLFNNLLNNSPTLPYFENFSTFVLYVVRRVFQFIFLYEVQEPQSKPQTYIRVL